MRMGTDAVARGTMALRGLPLYLFACAAGSEESAYPAGSPHSQAFSTDHFAYYSDEAVCPTLGERMETNFELAHAFLEMSPEACGPVRYFYYGEDADVSPPCHEDAGACYVGGDIVAPVWFHRHEAIHAYAHALGNPPNFFREGLAEMLGPGTGDGYLSVGRDGDLLSMIRGDAELDYATAASFTRFLVDTYGKAAFLAYYAAAPSDAASDEHDAAFSREFAASLEEVSALWLAQPDSYRGDSYYWLEECAAERVLVPPDTGPIALAPELDCADIPLDAGRVPGQVGAYRTVETNGAEALHLTLRSEVRAGVELIGCDAYFEGEPLVYIPEDATSKAAELWAAVDAGVIAVSLRESGVEGVSSGTTSVEMEFAPVPLGVSCDSAGTVSVGGTAITRIEGQSGETGTVWLRIQAVESTALAFDTASFVHGRGLPDEAALGAALCTGDCGSLTCDSSFWDDASVAGPELFMYVDESVLVRVDFAPDSHVRLDFTESD
jgi:hypothetical protein